MGFGYLFIGYVISLNFVAYGALTLPFAILLMLRGLLTLSRFNRPLKETYYTLWPTLLCSFISFFCELLRMLGFLTEATFNRVNTVLSVILPILLLLFTLRLLSGIIALTKETELPKLTFRAMRNGVLTAVAYLLYIFFSLPIEADWFAAASLYAFAPVILFRLLVMILNAMLIYSCYMWICMPEDMDMQRKKTGIAVIDEWNEKMDKKEEEAQQKKKEELANLYHEREAKYHEKQNKKGGHKK